MYDCQGPINNNVICQNLLLDEPSGGAGLGVCGGPIEDNIITGNREEQYGGGGLEALSGIIRNNIIAGNYSNFGGAGISLQEGMIENNVIAGNSTLWDGGGVFWGAELILNTIVANQAGHRGGGVACIEQGTVLDCIIWGNSAPEDPQLTGSVVPTYSCIQDWTGGGEGNITDSPMFAGWPRETGRWTADPEFGEKNWQSTMVNGEASWVVDEFKGLLINPDTTQPLWFVIASNTETTINVWGDMSEIIVGDAYEIYDLRLRSWSPCIDAGDPASEYSKEPAPNGGRVNMGACGNTAEAACKSPDTDSDGLPDDWELHWFGDLDEDSDGDADGDGKSNIEEYRNGSDPAPLTNQIHNVTKDAWYLSIQDALSESQDGDEIVVYPGLYEENINFGGKNVVLRCTDPEDPIVVGATVIDGDGAESVVTFAGTEGGRCILSGFTIRNGSAQHGGGICGDTSGNPTGATIRNNVIAYNTAEAGGGLYACGGMITDNIIGRNTADRVGAGLRGCHGTIQNNVICENRLPDEMSGGAGLYQCHGLIQKNIITANRNDQYGGGGMEDCHGTIRDNVIAGNFGYGWGGGISICHGVIQNNLICGNRSFNGGGLYICNGQMSNNTIVLNEAGYNGGGLEQCQGDIRNCIIWANEASEGSQMNGCSDPHYSSVEAWEGGGEGNLTDFPMFLGWPREAGQWTEAPTFDENTWQTTLVNGEALWTVDDLQGLLVNPDTSQPLQFVVASNTETTINVWGDVLNLADAGEDYEVYDYRIDPESPCVDAGDNSIDAGRFDLDENYRRIGTKGKPGWNGAIDYVVADESGGITLLWKGFIDIGAYECQVPGPAPETFTVYTRERMDLGDWMAVFSGNISQWTDEEAGARQRFYRVEME